MNFDSSTGYKVSLSKLFNQPVVQCQQQQYQIDELEAKNQALDKKIADQKEELQRLNQDNRHLEQEARHCDQKFARLKDEAQYSEKKVQDLVAENKDLTQKDVQCIQEIKWLKDEISKYKTENRHLEGHPPSKIDF